MREYAAATRNAFRFWGSKIYTRVYRRGDDARRRFANILDIIIRAEEVYSTHMHINCSKYAIIYIRKATVTTARWITFMSENVTGKTRGNQRECGYRFWIPSERRNVSRVPGERYVRNFREVSPTENVRPRFEPSVWFGLLFRVVRSVFT